MIEISISYGQLIWLIVWYLLGSFLGGLARGAYEEWHEKRKNVTKL